MSYRYAILLIALFVFASCDEQKKKHSSEKDKPTQRFLFNMELMFSDEDQNMSFPIWFDKRIIKEKKIKNITRHVYPVNAPSTDKTPKETRVYHFNEQGSITSVTIKKFYENMVVEDVTFKYNDVKDKVGYSDVEIINGEHQKEEVTDYHVYTKEKYNNKYLMYTNQNTGDYLFYMLSKKHWGAVSVDSILRPTPDDLIVLGTPAKPFKKYNVHNMVSETNVVELNYKNDGEVIHSVFFENYPFYYKRYMTYNNGGHCTGFIDSAFTSNAYLTRTVGQFKMNENTLPNKLIQSRTGSDRYELFEYEYYED